MRPCWMPQYSAHWPTEVPGRVGSIHTWLVLLGITSILPASWGTQKLWMTSTDSRVMKVGVGWAGSLTGTWSSLAVTTPSLGYRNSHQNWWPITVTSTAEGGFGASWMA